MALSAEMRNALEDDDVALATKLLRHALPQGEAMTVKQARVAFHYARTLTEGVSYKRRLYSHAWLLERGLPSGLPTTGETAEAVLVAVRSEDPARREVMIQAGSNAVLEAIADGVKDPLVIRSRILEMQKKAVR